MAQYALQKKEIGLHFKKGSSLSVQSLSISVTTEEKKRTLFRKLDLETQPGSLYWVCGESGKGKTVLLKTLAAVHPIDEGTITVPDHVWYLQPQIEIHSASESFADLLRKTFGIQDRHEVQTVKDYLQGFSLYYSSDQWEIAQVHAGQRDWSTLSSGQKQILNLAVVLTIAQKSETPWLILVDESLAHVDPANKAVALNLLKQLANGVFSQSSHTVLIIDHNDSGMQKDGEDAVKTAGAPFKIHKQPLL